MCVCVCVCVSVRARARTTDFPDNFGATFPLLPPQALFSPPPPSPHTPLPPPAFLFRIPVCVFKTPTRFRQRIVVHVMHQIFRLLNNIDKKCRPTVCVRRVCDLDLGVVKMCSCSLRLTLRKPCRLYQTRTGINIT